MELKRVHRWRSHLWAYAAFLYVTLAAYYPSLHGKLLWDDDYHVTRLRLRSLQGLVSIWLDPAATQQYYPLLHSAFWVEYRLWGNAVLGYHLVNVALHALAAYLVVLIVQRLELRGAWLAGLIFALHPVCVESVAWITEQKSTLSAMFYLSAALLYLRFDQSRSRRSYLQASVLFLLALLSKTVTATLPGALLVVLWWRRGRIERRRDVLPLLPWFAAGAGMGLFTAWVERHYIGAQGPEFSLSILQRCLLAGRVVWFYLSKLLWPTNLTFIYPRWTIDIHSVRQYVFPMAWITLGAVLAVWARRHRGPLATLLLFTGTLFPVLGFLNVYPFLYSYVADHFQYLASLAVIVPGAWALAEIQRRFIGGKTAGLTLAAILAIVLGGMTWRQSHMYVNVETLYRETLARNPESWLAHLNLGLELMGHPGSMEEAAGHFREVLRQRPGDPRPYNNLGYMYSTLPGRTGDAIAAYEHAIRLKPDFSEAHFNLGTTLLKIPGKEAETIAQFREVVRLQPEFAMARAILGGVLIATPEGRDEGIRQLREAVRLSPNLALAHLNLGTALSSTSGHAAEAVSEFEMAVRAEPNNPLIRYALGNALASTPGESNAAIREFETAIRLRPSFAEARVGLANALLEMPNGIDEAIDEYEAALRANPNLMTARAGLDKAMKLKAQSGAAHHN